jgi:hypothetical protein
MPLKLNVGLVKKVGLPNYSSLGASCHLELELDPRLLPDHPEEFQDHVRQAFVACEQSVEEELSRQGATPAPASQPVETANGDGACTNGRGLTANAVAPGRMNATRPATEAQIRALQSIAERYQLDLATELQTRFGVERLEELSVREASRFIDQLNLLGRNGSCC